MTAIVNAYVNEREKEEEKSRVILQKKYYEGSKLSEGNIDRREMTSAKCVIDFTMLRRAFDLCTNNAYLI